MKIKLAEMRWPEIEELLRKPNVVLLPLGSTEQHGRHLPVNFDTCSATYISEQVARRVTDEYKICVVVAPAIPYGEIGGIPPFTKMLPGSIGIRIDTAITLYYEVVRSLVSQGFKNVLVINGHAESSAPIQAALRKVNLDFPSARLYALNWYLLAWDYWLEIRRGGKAGSGHACELETSVSLVIEPENTRLDAAVKGSRSESLLDKYTAMPPGGTVYFHPVTGVRNSGVMGNPTAASKDTGLKYISEVLDRLTEIIVAIANSENMTFEEKL